MINPNSAHVNESLLFPRKKFGVAILVGDELHHRADLWRLKQRKFLLQVCVINKAFGGHNVVADWLGVVVGDRMSVTAVAALAGPKDSGEGHCCRSKADRCQYCRG